MTTTDMERGREGDRTGMEEGKASKNCGLATAVTRASLMKVFKTTQPAPMREAPIKTAHASWQQPT